MGHDLSPHLSAGTHEAPRSTTWRAALIPLQSTVTRYVIPKINATHTTTFYKFIFGQYLNNRIGEEAIPIIVFNLTNPTGYVMHQQV